MPPSAVQETQELLAIREAYELALQGYIKVQDNVGIQQSFDVLKALYMDPALPPSDSKWGVMGLYLTYLLSLNQIEEFHTDLELIPYENRAHPSIKFSIELEQYFMEGNYKQVLAAKEKAPAAEFGFFVARILDAIRLEVAASIETSYKSLSVASALQMLKLNSGQELQAFLQSKESGKEYQWSIEGEWISIQSSAQDTKEIPKWELISQAVNYAIELERIV